MQLISTPVIAWIPVRSALWLDRIEASEAALAEFCEALPSLLPMVESGLSNVSIAIAEPPAKVRKRLTTNIIVHAGKVKFLKIKARYTMDRDAFNKENPDNQLDDGTFSAIAAMFFGEAMETLLIFTEISHPGRIDTTEGIVCTPKGGYASVPEKRSFFQLWHPEEHDPKWPAI